MNEKQIAHSRHSLLYLYFKGFQICIAVPYLYQEGEPITFKETVDRGCRFLEENGVSLKGLPGYDEKEFNYEIKDV